MEVKEDIIISGFSVETTQKNNDRDLGLLYNDFIHNGKMQLLNKITENKNEYYGVM